MTDEQVVEAMELQKKGEMTNQQIANLLGNTIKYINIS
jgi:hypothetical protein